VELIVFLVVLVLLEVLAARYGFDSRDRPITPEELLASRGITWDETWGLPSPRSPRSPRLPQGRRPRGEAAAREAAAREAAAREAATRRPALVP
jgi:hypothetical protein